jgi:hypothetical protein
MKFITLPRIRETIRAIKNNPPFLKAIKRILFARKNPKTQEPKGLDKF